MLIFFSFFLFADYNNILGPMIKVLLQYLSSSISKLDSLSDNCLPKFSLLSCSNNSRLCRRIFSSLNCRSSLSSAAIFSTSVWNNSLLICVPVLNWSWENTACGVDISVSHSRLKSNSPAFYCEIACWFSKLRSYIDDKTLWTSRNRGCDKSCRSNYFPFFRNENLSLQYMWGKKLSYKISVDNTN